MTLVNVSSSAWNISTAQFVFCKYAQHCECNTKVACKMQKNCKMKYHEHFANCFILWDLLEHAFKIQFGAVVCYRNYHCNQLHNIQPQYQGLIHSSEVLLFNWSSKKGDPVSLKVKVDHWVAQAYFSILRNRRLFWETLSQRICLLHIPFVNFFHYNMCQNLLRCFPWERRQDL